MSCECITWKSNATLVTGEHTDGFNYRLIQGSEFFSMISEMKDKSFFEASTPSFFIRGSKKMKTDEK